MKKSDDSFADYILTTVIRSTYVPLFIATGNKHFYVTRWLYNGILYISEIYFMGNCSLYCIVK